MNTIKQKKECSIWKRKVSKFFIKKFLEYLVAKVLFYRIFFMFKKVNQFLIKS